MVNPAGERQSEAREFGAVSGKSLTIDHLPTEFEVSPVDSLEDRTSNKDQPENNFLKQLSGRPAATGQGKTGTTNGSLADRLAQPSGFFLRATIFNLT